jgi:hypothetical protein
MQFFGMEEHMQCRRNLKCSATSTKLLDARAAVYICAPMHVLMMHVALPMALIAPPPRLLSSVDLLN